MVTGGGGQVVTGAAASGSSGAVPRVSVPPWLQGCCPGQSPRLYDLPGPWASPLSVCPSVTVHPPGSASWRTWTTSVQNTLGHPLAQREQVTGQNSIHSRACQQRDPSLPITNPTSTPGTHRQGPRQVSLRAPPRLTGNPGGPGRRASCEAGAPTEQSAPRRRAQGLGLEPRAPGSVLPAGQREDTGSCSAPDLAKERHGWGCPT